MKHLTVKEKEGEAFEKMKSTFHYKNVMAAPKLQKIVLNVGTGTAIKKDKNKNDAIALRLAKITGQKPSTRGAKQSVASFKTRKGDPIGIVATLRGKRMYAFLEKLINVALPRTKDFRGINRKSVDNIGNLSIGIKEHTIFPETADEDIRDVFGLSITLVCTAKNKKEGTAFFELLGIPFKKQEEIKSDIILNMNEKGRKGGFTLIELLVVVAIISLLSSIVMASLNSARVKARDAQRKSDLHQLELAIQLYYDSMGVWPNTDGSTDVNTTKSGDWPSTFKTALSPYISKPPLDPLANSILRFYGAQPMTWSPDPNCNGKYVLWAYIEGANSGALTCGWGGSHYFLLLGPS